MPLHSGETRSTRKLIQVAADLARDAGIELDLADFHEFDMPLYDADLQGSSGFPSGARELARRIESADGLMIASPEYNYSFRERSRTPSTGCLA